MPLFILFKLTGLHQFFFGQYVACFFVFFIFFYVGWNIVFWISDNICKDRYLVSRRRRSLISNKHLSILGHFSHMNILYTQLPGEQFIPIEKRTKTVQHNIIRLWAKYYGLAKCSKQKKRGFPIIIPIIRWDSFSHFLTCGK